MTSILSERAMLSVLKISMFTARKLDKNVTAETLERHNAAPDAGAFHKRLLSKEAMADIVRIHGAARTFHYDRTLPWLDDGPRILSAMAHSTYWSQMERYQEEALEAHRRFVDGYPEFVEHARQTQNGLFNATDYPSPAMIGRKFGFQITLLPFPDAKDFRVDIGDAATARIRAEIEDRSREALGVAVKDVFERVKDKVSAMVERLQAYKPSYGDAKAQGIFRDSLVSNIADLVDLMPSLN